MFTQEIMICGRCGFKQQANPLINSGWFYLNLISEGKKFYVCPGCEPGSAEFCTKSKKYYDSGYQKCPWCNSHLMS